MEAEDRIKAELERLEERHFPDSDAYRLCRVLKVAVASMSNAFNYADWNTMKSINNASNTIADMLEGKE